MSVITDRQRPYFSPKMDTMTRLISMLVLAVAVTPGAVRAETLAPNGDSGTTVGTKEIIVTAEKRSQRVQDVPMSVGAVGGDTLRSLGISTTASLERLVPGFTYTQSPYGSPIYTIRGIGYFDESVGASPAVTIYLDQVPIPFPRGAEGAALDLERVEVLKGPQGTLFGQNSTGGAINYIAAKPTDTFKAGSDLSYGRFNDVDAQGFVSGPITDRVTARLAVRTEQRDGWQRSTSRDATLGKVNFLTGRILIDWTPSGALKFELNLNGWRDKSDTQANQFQRYDASALNGYPGSVAYPNLAADLMAEPPAPRNDRAADWDPGGRFRRDDNFYQMSLHGDWDIATNVTVTSITAYSRLRVLSPQDVDGSRFPLHVNTVDAWTKTFSQELRVAGSAGERDRLLWMIGGNYQHDRVSDIQHVANQGSNSGVGPFRFFMFDNNAAGQRIETKAAFGSLDYRLTETITAHVSARYTQQNHSLDGCLIDGDGGLAAAFGYLSTVFNGNPHVPGPGDPSYIPPGGCVSLDPVTNYAVANVHRVLNEDNVSWRGGLSWKPVANLMAYVNATRGYKGGSFGTIPAIRPAQFDAIKQESVTAYEAGAKATLFDRRLDVSGAFFWYDYRNKQLLGYISDAFFGSLPGLVSVPKSRIRGAEFNLAAHPNLFWTVSVGGTYIGSKVLSHFGTLGPLATSGEFDIRGEPLPDTPKWNADADIEYRHPVAGDWSAYIGGDVEYRSAATSTFAEPPEFRINGYALVDLRIGLEKDNGALSVQIWGRNITNQYYWRHVDHVLDTITRVTGMPATYGITFSVRA